MAKSTVKPPVPPPAAPPPDTSEAEYWVSPDIFVARGQSWKIAQGGQVLPTEWEITCGQVIPTDPPSEARP